MVSLPVFALTSFLILMIQEWVDYTLTIQNFFLCRTSTNSSTWGEKILSLETLPDSILDNLRKVHDVLTKAESSPSSFSLEFSLGISDDNSMRTNMMKFLRNAILLCLTAFPQNHILEEAALVAEELSNTRMNSLSCSVTPCRALAKSLLKRNRQVYFVILYFGILFAILCSV